MTKRFSECIPNRNTSVPPLLGAYLSSEKRRSMLMSYTYCSIPGHRSRRSDTKVVDDRILQEQELSMHCSSECEPRSPRWIFLMLVWVGGPKQRISAKNVLKRLAKSIRQLAWDSMWGKKLGGSEVHLALSPLHVKQFGDG